LTGWFIWNLIVKAVNYAGDSSINDSQNWLPVTVVLSFLVWVTDDELLSWSNFTQSMA